jgi:hypothetical protein
MAKTLRRIKSIKLYAWAARQVLAIADRSK